MSIATEPEVLRGDIWKCRAAVQQRLVGMRRGVCAHLLWEGLAWTAATLVALAAGSLLVDRLLRFELPTRIVLLTLGVAAVIAVAWRQLVRPLCWRLGELDIAELLDRRRPGVGQRITNVLQLPHLLQHSAVDGSPAMIEATVLEDAAALERIDLEATLNVPRRRKVIALCIATVVIVVAFFALFPTVAALWTSRWLGGSHTRWPQHTYLAVLGLNEQGQLLVPRGESTLLQVNTQPEFVRTEDGWRVAGRGQEFVVHGDEKPQSTIPDSILLDFQPIRGGPHKQGTFTRFDVGRFRYELPSLTESGAFRINGGDDWLDDIEVEPLDRPTVKNLTITAWPPGRTEGEVHRAGHQDAQLLFLPTTRVRLDMESDQPLTSARAVSQTAEAPTLERVDASHYRAEFAMTQPLMLEFQLVAERGGLNSQPFFVTIGLLNDRPPRVTIRSTGVGRRITPQARIPLVVHAVDDFGIANLGVDLEQIQIVDSKPETSAHQPYAEKLTHEGQPLPMEFESQPMVKLSELTIVTGNTVRMRGRASDACVFGPQDGTSRWLTFQVVTPEELFYEILTRQREQRARFVKTLEMAKGQVEAIQKLADVDGGSGLTRVHQVIARQVWQIAGQIDASLLEMTYNDLGSPQARELLENSIIVPLRKLHDETLTDVHNKLQTLLAGSELRDADRQQLLDAMQETTAQMQRILAQMSQWESFVDVVNQLRQIIKSQDQVLESTDKIEKDKIKGLFDK